MSRYYARYTIHAFSQTVDYISKTSEVTSESILNNFQPRTSEAIGGFCDVHCYKFEPYPTHSILSIPHTLFLTLSLSFSMAISNELFDGTVELFYYVFVFYLF